MQPTQNHPKPELAWITILFSSYATTSDIAYYLLSEANPQDIYSQEIIILFNDKLSVIGVQTLEYKIEQNRGKLPKSQNTYNDLKEYLRQNPS